MRSLVLVFSWCVICFSYSHGTPVDIQDIFESNKIEAVAENTFDTNIAGQLAVTNEIKETLFDGDLSASLHHLDTVIESLLGSLTGFIEFVPPAIREILAGAFKGAAGESNLVGTIVGLLSGTVAGTKDGILEVLTGSVASALSAVDPKDKAEIYSLLFNALAEELKSEYPGEYDAAALLRNVVSLLEHTLGLPIADIQNAINVVEGTVGGLLIGVSDGLARRDLIGAVTGGVRGATESFTDQSLRSYSNSLQKALNG